MDLDQARHRVTFSESQAAGLRPARFTGTLLVYVLLVALAVIMLFPYLWMLSNSFKPRDYFYTHPYVILPQVVTLATYEQALTIGRIAVYLRNSAVYASAVVIVQLTIDSLAAFAFARLHFPGRDAIFAVFLATMMLPFSVLLIPSYLLIWAMGLADTYVGVILPGFAGAFGIFLLRQFFLNIPVELEDAARIDGAGLLMIYARIILPLAQPALITLGVFLFMGEWSSYLWPLVVLNDWNKYPITVGIALYRDMSNIEWTNIFAASTLASFPVVVLFLLAQRYIVGGITLSGLKG
jgi:ABC-type glycerol-3-phosphate transport system permease component